MMRMLDELEEEVTAYMVAVNRDNFSEKYDGLTDILLSFRDRGLKKEAALSVLVVVDEKLDVDRYQEDVIIEVCNLLEGYGRPSKRIIW